MIAGALSNLIPQDASLLYSTVAQSTVVLVAIVGAFVLTESIKSRSQVFEVKIREIDLNLEKESLVGERDGVRNSLLLSNIKRFFRHHAAEYMKLQNQNEINFDSLWKTYQPPDLEPADKNKIKRTLLEIVSKFYNKADVNPSDEDAPKGSVGPDQDYYLLGLFVEEILKNGEDTAHQKVCRRAIMPAKN